MLKNGGAESICLPNNVLLFGFCEKVFYAAHIYPSLRNGKNLTLPFVYIEYLIAFQTGQIQIGFKQLSIRRQANGMDA